MNRPCLMSALLFACSAPLFAQDRDRPPVDLARVDAESARRSMARNAGRPHIYTGTCPYTTVSLAFDGTQTGTGLDEAAILMTPCGFNPAGPDLPLIVIFNGFCLGAPAIFNGLTQIPDEANARGWMVVAITCGGLAMSKKSYGIYKCQPNVEFVLDYIIQNYPVDLDRIYGVGWSAGGGAIVSYGARHLNPARPMFAAIATDAGTFDLIDSYNNVPADVKAFLNGSLMFGGPPSDLAATFGYLRTSTISFTPPGPAIDASQSQARNLVATPLYHVYSTDDPIPYLPAQQVAFSSYLLGQGASITTLPFTGEADPHSFDLLDPAVTLNFLQAHTLDREPDGFAVNADRDEAWYWADLTQRQAGSFSRITCATDPATNLVSATAVANVATLQLTPPADRFDPDSDFQLRFSSLDGAVTPVTLSSVAQSPTYVLNGVSLFKDWQYQPGGSSLRFDLPGGAQQNLKVRYDDYSADLTGNTSATLGSMVNMTLAGSVPGKPYILFIGFAEGVLPIDLFDPSDSRNLLIGFTQPPVLVQGVLNGSGQAAIHFAVPNDGNLSGMTLRCQFVTFPGGTKIVDEISNRHDVTIVSG